MHEQNQTQTATLVPRSIFRKGKNNSSTTIQQWQQSPIVQQQQTMTTTNQVEAGTVMSNLLPDDSV
jgi:hypothetical protein